MIKVRVTPGAKEEKVIQKTADSFEVYTKEKPKAGQATKAVTWLLLMHFQGKRVKLIKGARERNKVFEITDRI